MCLSVDGETCLEGEGYLQYTNEDGKVFFDKHILEPLMNKYGKLKFITLVNKNTKDIIAGKETSTTRNVVLTRTIFDLNNDDSINIISPFSTLVDLSSPSSGEEYDDRLETVASFFGEENRGESFNNDYNYEKSKWLIIGEFLVRLGILPNSFENLKIKQNTNKSIDDIVDETDYIKDFIDAVINSNSANTVDAIEEAHEELGQSFKYLASGASDDWRCGITQTNNAYCWGLAVDWCSLGNHEYCADHDKVWDKYIVRDLL